MGKSVTCDLIVRSVSASGRSYEGTRSEKQEPLLPVMDPSARNEYTLEAWRQKRCALPFYSSQSKMQGNRISGSVPA